jgi:hypothetical protein
MLHIRNRAGMPQAFRLSIAALLWGRGYSTLYNPNSSPDDMQSTVRKSRTYDGPQARARDVSCECGTVVGERCGPVAQVVALRPVYCTSLTGASSTRRALDPLRMVPEWITDVARLDQISDCMILIRMRHVVAEFDD